MVQFVYIGGKQPSNALHTDVNGNVTRDEAKDPTDAPNECLAFGLHFTKGVPLDVTPDQFTSRQHYENAVMRLRANRFFKGHADDIEFEDLPADPPAPAPAAPAARRGRPPKAIAAPVPDEAAE